MAGWWWYAACVSLRVQLDHPDVELGAPVRGQIELHHGFPNAKSLEVSLLTVTRRKGPVVRRNWTTEVVSRGPLKEGDEIGFSLRAPTAAPHGFESGGYAVFWFVEAHLRLAGRSDQRVEVPLTMRPREVAFSEIEEAAIAGFRPPRSRGQRAIDALFGRGEWGLPPLPFWPVIVPFVVPWGLVALADRWAWSRCLAGVELLASPRPLALGEWFPVTVRFRVKRTVEVKSVSVRLEGVAEWRSGAGKASRQRRSTFYEHEEIDLERVVVVPGESLPAPSGSGGGIYRRPVRQSVGPGGPVVEWSTVLRLPPDGPPVLLDGPHYLLRVAVRLEGVPDIEIERKLAVVSVRLSTPVARPETQGARDTSGDLSFVPAGATGVHPYRAGPARWLFLGGLSLTAFTGAAIVGSVWSVTVLIWLGLVFLVAALLGLRGDYRS